MVEIVNLTERRGVPDADTMEWLRRFTAMVESGEVRTVAMVYVKRAADGERCVSTAVAGENRSKDAEILVTGTVLLQRRLLAEFFNPIPGRE